MNRQGGIAVECFLTYITFVRFLSGLVSLTARVSGAWSRMYLTQIIFGNFHQYEFSDEQTG